MNRNASRPVQALAVAAAVAGALSLIGALPPALRFVLLAAFVLVGPGAAVVGLLPVHERTLRLLLVPAVGIATVLLATTVSVDYNLWSPRAVLAVLTGLTVVVALAGALVRRPSEPAVADRFPTDPAIGSRP